MSGGSFAVFFFGTAFVLGWFGLLTWLFDRQSAIGPLIALALIGFWVWLMLGSDF